MQFDLTTIEGRKEASRQFDKYGLFMAPGTWAIKQLFKTLSHKDTIQEQRKMATDIIKTANENNVDNVEIIIDNQAGFDFGSTINGIPIKANLGTNGKMTIKAEFKKKE